MTIRSFLFAALLCVSTGFTAYASCISSCVEGGGGSLVCELKCGYGSEEVKQYHEDSTKKLDDDSKKS